jgi:hypothetical protein
MQFVRQSRYKLFEVIEGIKTRGFEFGRNHLGDRVLSGDVTITCFPYRENPARPYVIGPSELLKRSEFRDAKFFPIYDHHIGDLDEWDNGNQDPLTFFPEEFAAENELAHQEKREKPYVSSFVYIYHEEFERLLRSLAQEAEVNKQPAKEAGAIPSPIGYSTRLLSVVDRIRSIIEKDATRAERPWTRDAIKAEATRIDESLSGREADAIAYVLLSDDQRRIQNVG